MSPFAAALAFLCLAAGEPQPLPTGEDLETFEPVPSSAATASVEPATSAPDEGKSVDFRARPYGALRTQLGVDTRFDSARGAPLAENVVDLLGRLSLGVALDLSPRAHLRLEGRGRWRGVAQRAFDRTKATFEPTLGEAYLDLYGAKVDVRVGHQVVAFGANAALAPSDALNPRDLREGLLLGEPEDAKLPAFAARAQGELGKVRWMAAYFPFFTPHRYAVVGQDEALVQPSLGLAVPGSVHESIEDELQPHLLETQRPRGLPWLGDVGFRVLTGPSGLKLGASWVWMNEKLPQVTVDPELSRWVSASAAGRSLDPATAISVENRLRAGETLFRGSYARNHLLSVEAAALLGPFQLDVDLAYSPAQTFVDEALRPVRKRALTAVLGLSQAEDAPFLYSLNYVGLAVPQVAEGEVLLLVEPSTVRGPAHVGWLHLVVAMASYRLLRDDLELSLRGVFEPVQRSFALAPRVLYRGLSQATLWVGAELFQGSQYSPLGYFDRNDRVLAGVEVPLF